MTSPAISPDHVSLTARWMGSDAASVYLTVEPTCGHRIFEVLAGEYVTRFMSGYGIDPAENIYEGGWRPGYFELERDGTLTLVFCNPRKRKVPSILPFRLDLPRILDTLADALVASRARAEQAAAAEKAKARARLVEALASEQVSHAFGELRRVAIEDPAMAQALANLREVYGATLARLQAAFNEVDFAALAPQVPPHLPNTAKSYGLDTELDAMVADAATKIRERVTSPLKPDLFELRITPYFGQG